MNTTIRKSKSGLEARIPDTGPARDAYDVACTAQFLGRRPIVTSLPGGEEHRDYGRHLTLGPARHAVTLHRISGQLHRIAEHECNGDPGYDCPKCHGNGWGCQACEGTGDAPRMRRLRAQAREIAAHYGLRAYFQGDPRGCSLYLIDEGDIPAVERLGEYVYSGDGDNPDPTTLEMREKLRARWIESNYTRGHAVTRLGR